MTIQHIGLCLVAVVAFGQTAPTRPEFEVASIKPSASAGVDRVRVGVHIDGSQVSVASLSLKEYIAIAYRVKNYQISGPDWISSERFDIAAKLPTGGAAKDVPAMLQALIEDRFQMKMHRESKDFPVYAMVIGKDGVKMQESAPDSANDSQSAGPGGGGVNVAAAGERRGVSINYGHGSYFTFADDKLEGKKLTAPAIADVLARFMDRPVVNRTNLKGEYDFLLQLSHEDYRAMLIRSAIGAGVALPPRDLQLAAAASNDSLFSAMEKLGLKLESSKAPLEVLVVDHIEKMPTEN